MNDFGFVYCFSNAMTPNIYKIGYTRNSPYKRLKELSSSSSVANEFEVIFYAETSEAMQTEMRVHSMFNACRVNRHREFFELKDEEIVELANYLEENCLMFSANDLYFQILYKLEQEKEKQNGKG